MKLRYTSRAYSDLESILSYLAEQSPQGARNVLLRINQVTAQLASQPYSGKVTSRSGIRVCMVGRYPYKVFSRIVHGEIQIVHIRHMARRPFEPK
jgi:plasmid stabilization system protein ParE